MAPPESSENTAASTDEEQVEPAGAAIPLDKGMAPFYLILIDLDNECGAESSVPAFPVILLPPVLNPSAVTPVPVLPVILYLPVGNDPPQRIWEAYYMQVLQNYRKAVAETGSHSPFVDGASV